MERSWRVTFEYRADIDEQLAGRLAAALVDDLPADTAAGSAGQLSVSFTVVEESITAALDPAERRRVIDILELNAPSVLWRIVRAEAVDHDALGAGAAEAVTRLEL